MFRVLAADRRGATAVLVGAALPFLFAATAAAVDIGAIALERRRMQGAVDAAALSAARNLAAADATARRVITANGASADSTTIQVTSGHVTSSAGTRSFATSATPDAVRVIATYRNPTYFLGTLGLRFKDATVSATASRRNLAALSIGSGVAEYDGGIVNAMTRTMTGSTVGLSLVSYQGLASADVSLFAFLDAIALRAGLGVITYDALLDQQVELPVILRALDDVSGGQGLGAVAAGILGTPRSIRLGDLVGLDMADAGHTGSGGASPLLATLKASELLGATMAVANRDSALAFDLASNLAGLGSLRVEIKVGEPMQSSPWLVVGDGGQVQVNTAQARLNLQAGIGPLLGLAVNLPVAVEVAASHAILDQVPCAPNDTAQVRARPGLSRLAVADLGIGEALPANAASLRPAPLIRAPLIAVDARGFGALESGGYQQIAFTRSEIAAHTTKKVSTMDGVSTLLATTLTSTDIDVRLLGLGLGLGLPGEGQIASRILQAAPGIETALFQLLAIAGLQIGTAHVRVDGYRCGRPVLVI